MCCFVVCRYVLPPQADVIQALRLSICVACSYVSCRWLRGYGLDDGPKAEHHAHEKAGDDLREAVLSQYHAARSHHARNDEDGAEPPHGVEGEKDGEGHQCPLEAAYGRAVGGDFPPHVDDGARYLYEQGRHEDVGHELWDAQQAHQVVTGEVAEDGDDIGNHSAFLLRHL